MTSIVGICNDALDIVGHRPITSLTEGTRAASLCNRKWPIIRDRELRKIAWNFSIKRTNTAPESTAPDWGFTYQHQIPNGCLKVLDVRDLRREDYQVEGNKILTNDDTLYVRYIARITDPNQYDPQFVSMVAHAMAAEINEPLNQNNKKTEDLVAIYDKLFMEAAMSDATENPTQEMEEDQWVEARY